MKQKIFTQALLPNAGLGNRLFTWGRFATYSHIHALPMFDPIWAKASIGPLLRREKDLRLYLDLFQSSPGALSLGQQVLPRLLLPRIAEPNSLQHRPTFNKGIIQFRGYSDYFAPLNEYRDYLRASLESITKPEILERLSEQLPFEIAINVRYGDFRVPNHRSDFLTMGGLRTPMDWFQGALRGIRRIIGYDASAVIVTDATAAEIAPLLAEPNVVVANNRNALEGMWLLSRGKFLIGSGGSSFTAWANFLGNVPTIVIRGQNLSWFKLPGNGVLHSEWDLGEGEQALIDLSKQSDWNGLKKTVKRALR